MDGMQDGEGADLWQPIRSVTQSALQRGERPGGCAICFEQRAASQFVLDAFPFRWAIAARMAAAGQVVQGGQSSLIEATNQSRDGVRHFPACCSRGLAQCLSCIYRQQGNRSLMADDAFAGGAAHALQCLLFGISQGTKGLGYRMGHNDRS